MESEGCQRGITGGHAQNSGGDLQESQERQCKYSGAGDATSGSQESRAQEEEERMRELTLRDP